MHLPPCAPEQCQSHSNTHTHTMLAHVPCRLLDFAISDEAGVAQPLSNLELVKAPLYFSGVVHPVDGRRIPIICDAELVDMSFGTGGWCCTCV